MQNVFFLIIKLYVNVHAHSFAKDIQEKHKSRKKANRKKSLRVELKRTNDANNV